MFENEIQRRKGVLLLSQYTHLKLLSQAAHLCHWEQRPTGFGVQPKQGDIKVYFRICPLGQLGLLATISLERKNHALGVSAMVEQPLQQLHMTPKDQSVIVAFIVFRCRREIFDNTAALEGFQHIFDSR